MIASDGNGPKFYRSIRLDGFDYSIIPEPVEPAKPIVSSLRQCKKLTNTTTDEYIKLRAPGTSGLPYSAKFRCGDTFWKLHGEGCLVTIGTHYVAQVSIESIPDLNDASDFYFSKELLLAHLNHDNVLFDKVTKETTDIMKSIQLMLEDLGSQSATDTSSALCLIELTRIADLHNYKFSLEFSDEVNSNSLIQHPQLKTTIRQYVQKNQNLEERSLFQRSKDWIQGLTRKNHLLQQYLQTAIDNHRAGILEVCTPHLKEKLKCLNPYNCLLLRRDDVKLFSDLQCALSESMFSEVFRKIEAKFIDRVTAIRPADYCKSLALVNNVYFHVCKSMVEIVNRVESELDEQNILEYGKEWSLTRKSSVQHTSPLIKCFVMQLQMLVVIANYFEPGRPTVRMTFPYHLQISLFKRSKPIQNECHVWLCLVDATLVHIFKDNTERLEVFSGVLEMFYKYVSSKESRNESQESVRMIAHNMLEFVAQVELSESGQNAIALEILQKQVGSIGSEFLNFNASFNHYRDIMDAWKIYWKRFNEVLPKLSIKLKGNHLQHQFSKLKNRLSSIVSQILDKRAESDDVIEFFRAYNDLFSDLEDISFEWYVKIQDESIRNTMLQKQVIRSVDNRLRNTENECYLVLSGKYDEFVIMCAAETIPKHYQIEVVKQLLDDIIKVVQKQRWTNGDLLCTRGQLKGTVLLINAIRSSFMYLKEQPDYIDFRAYYEETVKPFSSVIGESVSLEDFTKRVELIKESFWYIRNQHAIGIDRSMELFTPCNDNVDETLLKTSFQRYNDQFIKYMVECSKMSDADKIKTIVQDVCSKVKPLLSSKWTAELKQIILPEILAGLGAVWSIKISKDVASSGKQLKPHTIQILSILRLMGVDEGTTGVEKHLAQVLTGQGKSVILGLAAAVLALFSHKVVVVCYSSYLANRDSEDFRDLFRIFSLSSQIEYKIFQDMAFDEIQHLYGSAKRHISRCIGIAYNVEPYQKIAGDLSKAVLLIDEVDVFFMEKFYGETDRRGFCPIIPGLGKIQIKIWTMVKSNYDNVKSIIDEDLRVSNDPDVKEMKLLMQRPGRYTLIDHQVGEIEHTNESLFSSHLDQMVNTAIYIRDRPIDDEFMQNFRLDSNGNITRRDELGVFRTDRCMGYFNTFVYFKLRGNNFIQSSHGTNNFGYFKLRVAAYSYAKIPENYPLILGVSGTLDGMCSYEKDAIKNHYKIKRNSIMPSFFGSSNLKFDQQADFHCHTNVVDWRNAIFTRVNAIIGAHRSVIVFFATETEIALFRQEFQSQLDRMNEITVNTEATDKERVIMEAGLSRTVTLASREMGRGVDYKSSQSVEKNGGVHVIQTFFSLDGKEETQIKGRTARKDNHGSYELILCQPHLLTLQLISAGQRANRITYASLVESRQRLTDNSNEDKKRKLEESNAMHEKSIAFCEKI